MPPPDPQQVIIKLQIIETKAAQAREYILQLTSPIWTDPEEGQIHPTKDQKAKLKKMITRLIAEIKTLIAEVP